VAEVLQVPDSQVKSELVLDRIKEWDAMGHMGVMVLLEEPLGISI